MLDFSTALATRALVLSVMTLVFASAWASDRRARAWREWLAASAIGAVALFMMMVALHRGVAALAGLGQLLLLAATGFCWRAARSFGGRRCGWWGSIALPILPSLGLLVPAPPPVAGALWLLCGLTIVVQHGAIIREFWRDRADGCLSRYGLVASYAAFIVSCFCAVFNVAAHMGDPKVVALEDVLMQWHVWLSVFYTIGAGVFSLSLGFERTAAALRHLSLTDSLTGLPNRRAFEDRYAALRGRPGVRTLALALIDVDHFKRINDQHGHAAGDAALRTCATILEALLDEDAVLARVGGEEFAVLMPNRSAAAAHAAMDAVRLGVAATPLMAGSHALSITVSIGLCCVEGADSPLDDLLRRADASLYAAKRGGRDRVVAAV